MLKATKRQVWIAVAVAAAGGAAVGLFAKPTIKPRALGGPVAIVDYDPKLRERDFLGIDHDTLSAEQCESLVVDGGVFVTNVIEGGPADASGIEAGDLLLEADAGAITSREMLIDLSAAWKPDQIVKLTVGREDGETVARRIIEVRLTTFNRMRELVARSASNTGLRGKSE